LTHNSIYFGQKDRKKRYIYLPIFAHSTTKKNVENWGPNCEKAKANSFCSLTAMAEARFVLSLSRSIVRSLSLAIQSAQ